MALTPYQQLEQEFRRLHAFRGTLSLLRWDAAVMMPRGSADVRGEQLAALETEHRCGPRSGGTRTWKIQMGSSVIKFFALGRIK